MIEDLEMTDSIGETGERLFIEDFDTWDMTGYYLYSKLLRSGVSGHIGTWGGAGRRRGPPRKVRQGVVVGDYSLAVKPMPRALGCGGFMTSVMAESMETMALSMFREGVGRKARITVLLGTGHNL